jgi:DNA-binding beta-propeller fold protein YncE
VLNQFDRSIYKYDAGTLDLADTIPTPIAAPHFIEFSPDGRYYYVVDRSDTIQAQLAKYRASDDSLVALVTVPGSVFPTALVITPVGDTAYLCDFSNVKGRLYRYDVSGDQFIFIDSVIQAGYQSHDIDISGDGQYITAAGFNSDDIVIVDRMSHEVTPMRLDAAGTIGFGSPLDVRYGPYGVLIDDRNGTVLTACRKPGAVDQLRIIDFVNKEFVDSILIPVRKPAMDAGKAGPTLMCWAPNNSDIVYVTGFFDDALYVVNVTARVVIRTVDFPDGAKPFTVVTNTTGSRVYVSCAYTRPDKGMVYVLSGSTYSVLDSVQTGSEPFGIYWRPQ